MSARCLHALRCAPCASPSPPTADRPCCRLKKRLRYVESLQRRGGGSGAVGVKLPALSVHADGSKTMWCALWPAAAPAAVLTPACRRQGRAPAVPAAGARRSGAARRRERALFHRAHNAHRRANAAVRAVPQPLAHAQPAAVNCTHRHFTEKPVAASCGAAAAERRARSIALAMPARAGTNETEYSGFKFETPLRCVIERAPGCSRHARCVAWRCIRFAAAFSSAAARALRANSVTRQSTHAAHVAAHTPPHLWHTIQRGTPRLPASPRHASWKPWPQSNTLTSLVSPPLS